MGAKRLPSLSLPDNPAVLGYLAGLIDGEGCIGITSAFAAGTSRNVSHCLRVGITNTSDVLMVWLIDTLGSGRRASRNEKPGKWAKRYDWMVYGKQAEELLVAVLPYLVIKQAQARLAIEFRSVGRVQKPYERKRGGNPTLDAGVVVEREELKRQMSILNRRGPRGSTGEGKMKSAISRVVA